MRKEVAILAIIGAAIVAAIVADQLFLTRYKRDFADLERHWITTANQLATAKILHENLNHVRELVFENMDFTAQTDTISHQRRFFEFLTECVNDLKLQLISIEPVRPEAKGRIITYGYNLELEGDFFSLGELCAKFENSRRIVALDNFEVGLARGAENHASRKGQNVRMKMRVNTFRVRKN